MPLASLILLMALTVQAKANDGGGAESGAGVNGAEVIAVNFPGELEAGISTSGTIQMRNSGSKHWVGGQHALAVIGDPCGILGSMRYHLPSGYTLVPGGMFTFTIPIHDDVAGTCTIEFQMVEEGVEFFGETVSATIETIGNFRNDPIATLNFEPDEGAIFSFKLIGDVLFVQQFHFLFQAYNFDISSSNFGEHLFTIEVPQASGEMFMTVYAAVGNTYAVTSLKAQSAGRVHIYDGLTGEFIGDIEHPQLSAALEFGGGILPVGSTLVISDPKDNTGAISAGRLFIYDGDPGSLEFGDLLTTIDSPDLGTNIWFGNRLGRIGLNIIASRVRREGLFAYYPSDSWVIDGDPASSTFGFVRYRLMDPLGQISPEYLGYSVIDDNTFILYADARRYLIDSLTGDAIRELADDEYPPRSPYIGGIGRIQENSGDVRLLNAFTDELIYRFGPPPGYDMLSFGGRWLVRGNYLVISAFDGSTNEAVAFVYQIFPGANAAPHWPRYR